MPWRRTILAAMLLLTLGSCTRSFLVKAAFLDGSLVFKSDDDRRTFYPWCWHSFTVVDERGLAAWEFEVPYGAFKGREECGPNFPIRYGEPPKRAETMVPAQRLEVGKIYVINGDSAGLLEGAFKIERVDGGLKVRNLDPNSGEALTLRDSYFNWQRNHDPPRISQTPTDNAAFEVQSPPRVIPKNASAGRSGVDESTWVLHPDPWWNLPSLSYQTLTGVRTSFNLWCRYTGGPIYARVQSSGRKGTPLALTSGSQRLEIKLIGAGNPARRNRVDAVLAPDSPVLRSFSKAGALTVETAEGKLEANAINRHERAVIKRFFDLCAMPSSEPSSVVETTAG